MHRPQFRLGTLLLAIAAIAAVLALVRDHPILAISLAFATGLIGPPILATSLHVGRREAKGNRPRPVQEIALLLAFGWIWACFYLPICAVVAVWSLF